MIKYLWNKVGTRSVVGAKLREISINSRLERWEVKGWYNKKEHFYFGDFRTRKEARIFIENLHKGLI